MPITLNIVNHSASGWRSENVSSADALLKKACPKQYERCERIVQSSFNRSSLRETYTSPSGNGFIWSAYHAYSDHHHLIIRPEDVWFAILTQMSFYINANAEKLRTFFVAHEGQKELEVISNVADFGRMAQDMTDLIAKNVVDPGLRDWVMPSFSTTIDCDRIVGAVLFMGAMQKYFSYRMTITCGIPSVTLLGEADDWREMLGRLDKLELLGEEPSIFAGMLKHILSHMVLSFEEPESAQVLHFWNTIVHHNSLFSGTDYLSGWLTAFCYWDEEGTAKSCSPGRGRSNTLFKDVQYPTVDTDKVPAGFASVPVTVNDNGDEYNATMLAGSVGILASLTPSTSPLGQARQALSSWASHLRTTIRVDDTEQTEAENRPQILNTLQPLSGWWIFENIDNEETGNVVKTKPNRERLSGLDGCHSTDGGPESYVAPQIRAAA